MNSNTHNPRRFEKFKIYFKNIFIYFSFDIHIYIYILQENKNFFLFVANLLICCYFFVNLLLNLNDVDQLKIRNKHPRALFGNPTNFFCIKTYFFNYFLLFVNTLLLISC